MALGNELIIEKVLYIHENLVATTYGENGPAPMDPQQFRAITRDLLRTSLDMAANTRLEPTAFGRLAPAQDPEQALFNSFGIGDFPVAGPSAQFLPSGSPAQPIVNTVGFAGDGSMRISDGYLHIQQQFSGPPGDLPTGNFGYALSVQGYQDLSGENQQLPEADAGGWPTL